MDKQKVFEKALRGVYNQGRIARRGGCYYIMQDHDGKELRCAVGHLLSREQAMAFQQKGGTVGNFRKELNEDPDVRLADAHDMNFLMYIQSAHDVSHESYDQKKSAMDDFLLRMKRIADDYHLTFPSDVPLPK